MSTAVTEQDKDTKAGEIPFQPSVAEYNQLTGEWWRGATLPAPLPEGWRMLNAGPVRQIRVNRQWLLNPDAGLSQWRIIEDGEEIQVAAVRFLGQCYTAERIESKPRNAGCGGGPIQKGHAWIETTGAILVKD